MNIADAAYAAGLFDGEGHVEYKKRLVKQKKGKNKAYNTWSIRCEMSMTDKETIKWCHDTFNCGAFGERKVKKGYKRQWRWRVAHRDALYVAKILWPYAQVKLHKIEQIIDHYEPRIQDLADNVVDLETERKSRIIATDPWNNYL